MIYQKNYMQHFAPIGLFLLTIIPFRHSFGQTIIRQSKKQSRMEKSAYVCLGLASNSSKFRDFATSPLNYNGNLTHLSISRLKQNNNKEFELGLSYDFGKMNVNINDQITSSSVKKLDVFYTKLMRFNKLSFNGYITKVGFEVKSTGIIRSNPSLQNNSSGIDIFTNILGVAKFTRDISRKTTKAKKLLFIKYRLNERNRDIALRLNLGLINSNARNGFAYTGQGQIINAAKSFDNYKFNIFSGVRLGSQINYTSYLKNKNAVQLSYIWDAYSTKGFDKFQMANHAIKIALLFNTNNK